MKKIIFCTWVGFLIILFAPFFFLGVIVGQFIGSCFFGYKEGNRWIQEKTNELKEWVKRGEKSE